MKYVIDMSALIFSKEFYPPDNAKMFWKKLKVLNQNKKLILITQIKNEINKGNDKDYLKKIFLKESSITSTEFEAIIDILSKIGNEVQGDQREGFRQWLKCADPYVIAYAYYLKSKGEQVMVIHGESQRGNKLKIDTLCNKYEIEHGRVNEIIRREEISLG